jgi:hypothetical protein
VAPAKVVRPRLLDWTETESLTARLASLLRERAESGAGTPFTYAAIPRGGLFVLGTLAYLLDLPPERIAPSVDRSDSPGPLVLVDDCALSGARIARELDRLLGSDRSADPGRRVIVAHLCSHPELRRAVEAAEPRVEACLAAADLAERADLPSETREGFQERWRARLPGRRYWLGAVEPIVFPWSEPESVWWNARDERLEDGWRRVPPRRTLRARAELGLPPDAAGAEPAFDLAPGTLWKLDRPDAAGDEEGDRLSLRSPDGGLFGFRGTALDVWRALLAGGDRAAAARRLTALYEVEEGEARRDVDELVDLLVERGLLVPRSE